MNPEWKRLRDWNFSDPTKAAKAAVAILKSGQNVTPEVLLYALAALGGPVSLAWSALEPYYRPVRSFNTFDAPLHGLAQCTNRNLSAKTAALTFAFDSGPDEVRLVTAAWLICALIKSNQFSAAAAVIEEAKEIRERLQVQYMWIDLAESWLHEQQGKDSLAIECLADNEPLDTSESFAALQWLRRFMRLECNLGRYEAAESYAEREFMVRQLNNWLPRSGDASLADTVSVAQYSSWKRNPSGWRCVLEEVEGAIETMEQASPQVYFYEARIFAAMLRIQRGDLKQADSLTRNGLRACNVPPGDTSWQTYIASPRAILRSLKSLIELRYRNDPLTAFVEAKAAWTESRNGYHPGTNARVLANFERASLVYGETSAALGAERLREKMSRTVVAARKWWITEDDDLWKF